MKKKRFSEEKIVRLLLEVERGEATIAETCKTHGISEPSYYRWKKKYGGLEPTDIRRLHELQKENARLKRLVAERDLEIDAMKDVLSKNW